MEKGDEEVILPTLAYRENEKTGDFFRLFKRDLRADGENWEVQLSHLYQGYTVVSVVISFRPRESGWIDTMLRAKPHVLALSGQLSIKSEEQFSTKIVKASASVTENKTAILIVGRDTMRNQLLVLVPSSLLREVLEEPHIYPPFQEFHDNFQAIARVPPPLDFISAVERFSMIRHIYLPVQEFHDNFPAIARVVQKEHLNAPYRVRDQTSPLDSGLSHPIKPTTIETDPPPETSPAYIAATSLSSKSAAVFAVPGQYPSMSSTSPVWVLVVWPSPSKASPHDDYTLEKYGDIHVLRWDSYHKSLEETSAFWVIISALEMISKSSLRHSTEFKKQISLHAFQNPSKAKQEEGKAFGTLSSWLWEWGRESFPLPPQTLRQNEHNDAIRAQLSRSNFDKLGMSKVSPYVPVFLKSFIRSLAKMNLMMRQEANFPDRVLASFNYRNYFRGSVFLGSRKYQSSEAQFFISPPDISRERDYIRPARQKSQGLLKILSGDI
ncbi:hypothetical protein BPAE_0193g00100 [Botrytis paeoniae]|uniref:Uncharacterized protein n=1 Tax=Botrytis paeoniae TaxID=278948 RepID=A0A4Z1FAV7_9HELO|nr:hypothetical protein BPAE_0193g00100 [Botrytis paeoniae]